MGAALVKKCFVGDCCFTPMPPATYPYVYRAHKQQMGAPHGAMCDRQTSSARTARSETAATRPDRHQPLQQPRYVAPHQPQMQMQMPMPVPPPMQIPPQAPRELKHRTSRRSRQGSNDSRKWGAKSPTKCCAMAGTPQSVASTCMSESMISEDSFFDLQSEPADDAHFTPRSVATPQSSRHLNPNVDFTALLPRHYIIEGVLGSGTTSTCYRCRRVTDGQTFACKVINKRRLAVDRQQREELTRQLRREVEVMKQLDHPNITKLEESFENDTFMLLVMELLEGGELFDAIVERGRLAEKDALHIARSVLSALNYMHAQGIVHRDLKPENLLLTASKDGKMTVKLIDFGFSRNINARGTMSSFLGTGGYLAPEILMHHRYTASVDMWSFGVIVYLMLSGRLPFASATQLRPGQQITTLYRLTFPRKYWTGVSEDAKDFVQSLLVLSPHRRMSAIAARRHPWIAAPFY